MTENLKKINKAFILAGGSGSRINIGNMHNIKAFIEIDNEQLLKRHIRLIKKNLNKFLFKLIFLVIIIFVITVYFFIRPNVIKSIF